MFSEETRAAEGRAHVSAAACDYKMLCFSDIDGTLVHYEDMERFGDFSGSPEDANLTSWRPKNATNSARLQVLRLPPSHSGSQGTISVGTLTRIAHLRTKGAIFVLVTGGRLSTLLQRLPFLPAADAYVCESGGRIFYPNTRGSLPTACPLEEDMEWRLQHNAAGSIVDDILEAPSHVGSEAKQSKMLYFLSNYNTYMPAHGPPLQEWKLPDARQGSLWDAYRMLKSGGWKPDTTSYTTAFRLKLPKDRSQDELQAVIPDLPPGLTTSFNLGCLDVYPATSGKHHAGSYLLAKFGVKLERSVLLCDDDNDLGLAAVVSRAFLPSLTSDSIRAAAAAHPDRFVTSGKGAVLATEDMLQHVEDVLDSYTS